MGKNPIIFNVRIVTPTGASAHKGAETGQLRIIEDGTVEVTKDIITYVGESRGEDYDGYCQYYWHYNAWGHCLLLGFVDSHTHFVFGGERLEESSWQLRGESYTSIIEHGGGIASIVKATRQMNFPKLRSAAESFLKKVSVMGATMVEGKSGHKFDRETELLQLETMHSLSSDEHKRIDIISTFLGAHALPEEYKGRRDEYIDFLIREMLPVIREDELAKCCNIFCEQGIFSVEQSRRLLQAAKEQGFLLKLHAGEIVPLGGTELAVGLGTLSTDHLLQAPDAGIRAMVDVGVIATLLPLTTFTLKESYVRGREMIDTGCVVTLAIDLNPGSCLSGSISLTIALACTYMRLSIEGIITALTLNGVAALHRIDQIGSIEVGKQGGLVILDSDNYHIPLYTIYIT